MSTPPSRSVARYFVSHLTRYDYRRPVANARHVLHLTPRELPWQHVVSHVIDADPIPNERAVGRDNFGNPVETLAITHQHSGLDVHARSWVEIAERPQTESSPAWQTVRDALAFRAAHPPLPAELEAARFQFESRHVRVKRELAEWAARAFAPDMPLLDGVQALNDRIHTEFAFDPEATHIATPVMEVLKLRRGVCQDFAHLMLSGLRSLGLAARYMSGYLLTTPPPGKERLIGADASHAWVAVWCPESGWVEFDPTNGVRAGSSHITLGWGRDFSDVTPLRGVIFGGGEHTPEIEVSVVPEADYAALFGAARRA
ncbi:transglutaminase family protein [Niveibacterium umoris]|uniref:Transglutaminase-like putative cysteine protease n=1 Tax=Niveibacterium umoris TaxID=1193620 RepID=A0A840BI04_9RHOO|nr:transglutaminase family protein [Niveibacterium umoris]MBB4012263.1 transglutaminase-like putative cysteine protease [Niveibacterium umoris]